MRTLVLVCLVASQARAEPPNVEFPSDGRVLKGWLYRPAGASPAPAVIWNHGSNDEFTPTPALVKTYLDHGFVILLPVRRYHRPSGNGETAMQRIHSASPWKRG